MAHDSCGEPELECELAARTPRRPALRRQLLKLARAGVARGEVASFLDLPVSTVSRWIARTEAQTVLTDAPRSGRPQTFDGAFRIKAIAFYCQAAPLPGCARWSLRDAMAHLENQPASLGRPVSRSTLHRILASHSLRPYRRKYYLQITDPDFFPKMEHLLGLLHHPPDPLFCFDECTCIQALTPLGPDWRTAPGHTRCREAQYRRNGTTDLIAFLRRGDSEVFGRCTPNHNRHTLIDVLREHVEPYPHDAALHYICDNLNTHYHHPEHPRQRSPNRHTPGRGPDACHAHGHPPRQRSLTEPTLRHWPLTAEMANCQKTEQNFRDGALEAAAST